MSFDEKISLEPSIVNSAFPKYAQLGSSAENVVLPDADLHVKVAVGSPGLNELKRIVMIAIVMNFRIKNKSCRQRSRIAEVPEIDSYSSAAA